jgi:hypothetical protein
VHSEHGTLLGIFLPVPVSGPPNPNFSRARSCLHSAHAMQKSSGAQKKNRTKKFSLSPLLMLSKTSNLNVQR